MALLLVSALVVVITMVGWQRYQRALAGVTPPRADGYGESLFRMFGRRGVVMVGEGCYVPVAFASATLLRRHANVSVSLFTTSEGISMLGALATRLGNSPFDTVVDATTLLSRHDGTTRGFELQARSLNSSCAFRLQKILTIGRSPYEHTVFMDADAFPCSARLLRVFDEHDAAGTDMMLMPEPTRRKNGYNSGFMSVKNNAAVRALTARWLERVARSCAARRHTNAAGKVLDQPDLLKLLTSMRTAGELTFAEMPYELQACRPEMWKNKNESLLYLKAFNQPPDLSLLERPPCPIAHINPFKNPWMITGRVDKFCDTKGLGPLSKYLLEVLHAGFSFHENGHGIPAAKAATCRKRLGVLGRNLPVAPVAPAPGSDAGARMKEIDGRAKGAAGREAGAARAGLVRRRR